jgi:hypothetical protein
VVFKSYISLRIVCLDVLSFVESRITMSPNIVELLLFFLSIMSILLYMFGVSLIGAYMFIIIYLLDDLIFLLMVIYSHL